MEGVLRNGASFLLDALRTLGAFLDGVVYALVSLLYKLFFDVSGARIIDSEHIKTLFQNFQLLVLVVALFAIAVSVIKYIIDPDKVNEKSNPDNASKLVSRIVVSFVLLLTVNTIFSFAYRLQDAVIENGFISKLILGNNIADSYDVDSVGVAFSKSILRAFITKNDNVGTISKQNNIKSDDDFFDKIGVYHDFYIIIPEYINDKDDEENYILDYLPIISTLVGGFIGYILLTYVIGVAVRVIQLVYLQIIAPVPILMNVTPGGKDKLMIWVRQCITTYIDLFIRHLVIYLTLFLCSVILTEGVDTKYNFSDNQNVLNSNYSYLDNVDTRMVAYADGEINNLSMLNNNSDMISTLQNETLNIDDNSNYSINTIQLANASSSSGSSEDRSEMFVKIAIVIGIMVFARKAPSLIMELFPSSTKASGNYGFNLKNQLAPATSMLTPTAGVAGGAVGVVGAATGVAGLGVAGAVLAGGSLLKNMQPKKISNILANQRNASVNRTAQQLDNKINNLKGYNKKLDNINNAADSDSIVASYKNAADSIVKQNGESDADFVKRKTEADTNYKIVRDAKIKSQLEQQNYNVKLVDGSTQTVVFNSHDKTINNFVQEANDYRKTRKDVSNVTVEITDFKDISNNESNVNNAITQTQDSYRYKEVQSKRK